MAMLGRLTGSVHTARPGGITSLTLMAMIAMAILMPSAASASGCDNWTNTKGGSWFEGTNWSSKAPPTSTEEACITAAGTYTVTMTQTGTTGTVTVKSLAVGGSSGTQTLVVSGSDSLNATLTATSGITITAAGAARLTNGEAEANSVTLVGPITNAGTITTETGVGGGARTFQGNLKNTGTLAINTATTFNGASAMLTNEGALNVAEGKTFAVSNKASFTNGTGGKIVGTANGDVSLESGTSFTEAAGTTSGTSPVIVDDGALSYTGAGASTIVLRGASTLSGSISLGQSLIIQGTDDENATVTAAVSFTNAGAITLTQIETENNRATLALSSGVLSNSGTITTEAGAGSGSARNLEGSVTNKGTLAIDVTTGFGGSGAVLINDAAINIAVGATFLLPSGQTFSNETGGTIAATGTGQFEQRDGTFNEGAGKSTGTSLVLDDDALHYMGAGASTIVLRGTSTLSGNISAGQSLTIQGTDDENATVTAAASFTNGGKITLIQIETENNRVNLVLEHAGTLTNKGTITIGTGPTASSRTIEGNVKNEKSLLLAAGATLTLVGSYTQGKKAGLQTTFGVSGDPGKLSATGTAVIAGKLTIKQSKTFKPAKGESFALLSSSGLSGKFSSVKGKKIKKSSSSYVPTYSATAVTLVVS
jgi:hypothetical protein